jgi:hypothetical protein
MPRTSIFKGLKIIDDNTWMWIAIAYLGSNVFDGFAGSKVGSPISKIADIAESLGGKKENKKDVQ